MKTTMKTEPKTTKHILHRDDFTDYALTIGVWQGLCEDHGVSPDVKEIEITVTAVKEAR